MQCKLAGVPVVRSMSDAVSSGLLAPKPIVATVLLPICRNRNPAGVRKQDPDPCCQVCGLPRSKTPWRADGFGRICKSCASARRKENRRKQAAAQQAAQENVSRN